MWLIVPTIPALGSTPHIHSVTPTPHIHTMSGQCSAMCVQQCMRHWTSRCTSDLLCLILRWWEFITKEMKSMRSHNKHSISYLVYTSSSISIEGSRVCWICWAAVSVFSSNAHSVLDLLQQQVLQLPFQDHCAHAGPHTPYSFEWKFYFVDERNALPSSHEQSYFQMFQEVCNLLIGMARKHIDPTTIFQIEVNFLQWCSFDFVSF